MDMAMEDAMDSAEEGGEGVFFLALGVREEGGEGVGKSAVWRSPDSMSSVMMARCGVSMQTARSCTMFGWEREAKTSASATRSRICWASFPLGDNRLIATRVEPQYPAQTSPNPPEPRRDPTVRSDQGIKSKFFSVGEG